MSTKYNDYKIHTARKGDSVQSICSQYGVTEDDLVKANSHIKLASYGGGFFSSAKLRLDIQAGDKVNIPFYNPEKNKRGVKKITGKNRVKVGVWENYQVAEWYDDTPLEERNEAHVKWDLYLLKNGTKPELVLQKEEGKIRFQEKAIGHNFKVVGYIHEPELDNASSIVVHVEASEKREILKITLSDINNKPITGTLSYGQTINVHVTTTGMKGEYLFLSLWEDDAQGAGHHESNKHNLVAEAKVMVNSKGIAFHQFLIKADFQKIANAYLSKGTSNEGNIHEYYVTAYATGETKASPNVNVRNPEYQQKHKEETKAHLEDKKTKPKPPAPDYKAPVPTVRTPQKPPVAAKPATPVGISSIYIKDENGNPLTKSKYGNTIRVYINSTGLKGKKVRIWLYEQDTTDPNDELFAKDIVITGDSCYEKVTLTSRMQTKGSEYEIGEGNTQELFARAKILEIPSHIISKRLKADITSTVVEVAESTSVVKVGETKIQGAKGSNCGERYCIKKGDKSELIREINIRLAGFGGNVPTDEFTDRTEKMIKQFQRDYMKVPETGKVCGNVLRAIDDFQNKYAIHFEDTKCKCGKCKGFGNGKFSDQKQDSKILELARKYEYPGMHRSLLWAVKASIFYASIIEKDLKYSINCIFSSYRCHEDNKIHKRSSTNHMGKAVDLHINKNGIRTRNVSNVDEIRQKVFVKHLGSQIRWDKKNMFSLEPGVNPKYKGEFLATTWIHLDVRQFELKYLEDKFFVKSLSDLNGENLITLAQKTNPNTCKCMGMNTSASQVNQGVTVDKKQENNFTVEDGKSALLKIYKKYGKDIAIAIERMYRDETGHFKSIQYKKCGTGGMESHGKAPYYGWDPDFFESNPKYKPYGLWSAFENKGMSEQGGNKQVTDRKKEFVILPSVTAGMEYKAFYINKYNGNWARWHSTEETAQKNYKKYIEKITPRFVNEFEKNKL